MRNFFGDKPSGARPRRLAGHQTVRAQYARHCVDRFWTPLQCWSWARCSISWKNCPTTETGRHKNKPIVTLQTTDSFASRWLLPRLPEFEALHPGITIKIVTYDFRDDLRADEADLGILFVTAESPGAASSNDRPRLLFPEEIFPVCSPKIVQNLKSIRVGDLANFTLIHDDNVGVSWQDWIAAASGNRPGATAIQTKDGAHYNHAHLALTAAELGNGFTLASNVLTADALEKGRLIAPFAEKIITGCGYYLAQSEKARARSECRAFGEWICSCS